MPKSVDSGKWSNVQAVTVALVLVRVGILTRANQYTEIVSITI